MSSSAGVRTAFAPSLSVIVLQIWALEDLRTLILGRGQLSCSGPFIPFQVPCSCFLPVGGKLGLGETARTVGRVNRSDLAGLSSQTGGAVKNSLKEAKGCLGDVSSGQTDRGSSF